MLVALAATAPLQQGALAVAALSELLGGGAEDWSVRQAAEVLLLSQKLATRDRHGPPARGGGGDRRRRRHDVSPGRPHAVLLPPRAGDEELHSASRGKHAQIQLQLFDALLPGAADAAAFAARQPPPDSLEAAMAVRTAAQLLANAAGHLPDETLQ